MGEMITIGNDSIQGKAYLAQPDLQTAPGVLIFHAWWGLNSFFKQLSDRICSEGLVVLTPDYYQGRVASSIEHAKVECLRWIDPAHMLWQKKRLTIFWLMILCFPSKLPR
jgi:dienelactone hydrolase